MALNDVLKEFADFVRGLKFESELPRGVFVKISTVMLTREDCTITLTGEDADRYTGVVQGLCEAIAEKGYISKRAVEKLCGDCIVAIIKNTSDRTDQQRFDEVLEQGVRKLKASLLEKPQLWEVHLVVEGLAPSGLVEKFGPVNFYFCDEDRANQLAERLLSLGRPRPAEEATPLRSSVSRFLNHAVARVDVKAVDADAAYDLARKKIRGTCDAINFYALRGGLAAWVSLPGDTNPGTQTVLWVREGVEFSLGGRRVGPTRALPLNQVSSRPGFERVSEMLSSDSPSDLEERILSALQWAGRAQIDERREEAFLLFAISLESVILGRHTTAEITHKLAVRCAHLGGGSTLEEKQLVVDQINKLYRVRSKIVHSGNFEIANSDLELMREYAVVSLFILIDKEPFRSMRNESELEEWFETQLLSGGLAEEA